MPCGKPRMYKTAEAMEKKINEYFESCRIDYLTDENGEFVFTKSGDRIIVYEKHPTVIGLALHLGFTSQEALDKYLDYEVNGKKVYVEPITRAKAKIQDHNAQMLYNPDKYKGSAFVLQNGFGWTKKEESTVKEDITITVLDDE